MQSRQRIVQPEHQLPWRLSMLKAVAAEGAVHEAASRVKRRQTHNVLSMVLKEKFDI